MAFASGSGRFGVDSKEFDLLKKELRSIALSVGPLVFVSVEQLDRDYADLNGHPIRYYDYGFGNLYDLLTAMADSVMLIDYGADGVAVVPISGEKTLHMEKLVAEQRPNEPTRFGGVVPGLDNKESNRNRNNDRRGSGGGRGGRGRSESRRSSSDGDPATTRKRTVSTFNSSTVFEENVAEQRRNEPKPTIAATTAASASRRNVVEEQRTLPVSQQSTSGSEKVSYTREDLIGIRKISSGTTTTVTDVKYLYHNEGEDFPDMDMIQFVIHNVINIVKMYPGGINLPTLTLLYKQLFPKDPPIELVESLGFTMEEFFADNFNGAFYAWKSDEDGIFMLKPRLNCNNVAPLVPSAAASNSKVQISEVLPKISSKKPTSPEPALINFCDDDIPQKCAISVNAPVVGPRDLTTTLQNLMISERESVTYKHVSSSSAVEHLEPLIYFDDSPDDDPAVLAFERRSDIVSPMVSPPRPIASDDLLRSPLLSRTKPLIDLDEQQPKLVDYKAEFSENDTASSIVESSVAEYNRSVAGSSTTPPLYALPEKAPLLDQTKMNEKVKISQKIWQEIYSVLREFPEGLEHARFTIEYARRFQRAFGGNTFYEKCGVKSLRDLLFEIQYIEVFENRSGNLAYRLRRRQGHGLNLREKEEKYKKICKSAIVTDDPMSSDDDLDDDYFTIGANVDGVRLPHQPPELLPSHGRGRISDIIRFSVYRLLLKKFPHGVELTQFTIAYSKFYKSSINAETECKMTYSEVYRSMSDILDVGEDGHGQLWLRAKPIQVIKQLQAVQQPDTPAAIEIRRRLEKILNPVWPPTEPPEHMPIEVCERLDSLLLPSKSRGVPFNNFKTLYTQPSLLAFFQLYGYQSFEQLFDCAIREHKVEVFTTLLGDKRIRLQSFKPVVGHESISSERIPSAREPSLRFSHSIPTDDFFDAWFKSFRDVKK